MKISGLLSFVAVVFGTVAVAFGQLPDIPFPEVAYTPQAKKGWVGQYVYRIKLEGKQTLKPSKFEYSYDIRIDRTHTGFVELTSEVRAAIRINQPDKNNGTRWESWIPIGTKKTSWSMQDEFLRTLTAAFPTLAAAAVDRYATLMQVERNVQYNSNGAWINGRTHYVDLQIDHTERKYSLAVPKVEFNIEGEDWGTRIAPDGKSTVPYREKLKGSLTHQGSMMLAPINWDILTGSFAEGQREIVIRERIPVIFAPEAFEERRKSYRLPPTTGFLDFYMVLNRVG